MSQEPSRPREKYLQEPTEHKRLKLVLEKRNFYVCPVVEQLHIFFFHSSPRAVRLALVSIKSARRAASASLRGQDNKRTLLSSLEKKTR